MNQTLSMLLREKINCVGCGRTDTGVHATGFFAHFDASHLSLASEKWLMRLNKFLPDDISAHSILAVKPDAHARFDALSRTYLYCISRRKEPFNTTKAYYYWGPLDMKEMNRAASFLTESSSFRVFAKTGSYDGSYECRIHTAKWKTAAIPPLSWLFPNSPHWGAGGASVSPYLIFTINANRFLRGMVRAIAGTLLEVGCGKMTPWQFSEIIKKGERMRSKVKNVPAHGLYLVNTEYPPDIFISTG